MPSWASVEACSRAGIPIAAFNLYQEQSSFASDLRTVVKGVISTLYAPRCLSFLFETVNDVGMPARVRVDSARILLDRAGYAAAAPAEERDSGDLTQMSRDELHRFVKEAEAKLATEAKDVSPAGETPREDESDGAPLPDDSLR